MTPSRALLIFKNQGKIPGHAQRREALPWWIFGFVGGCSALVGFAIKGKPLLAPKYFRQILTQKRSAGTT